MKLFKHSWRLAPYNYILLVWKIESGWYLILKRLERNCIFLLIQCTIPLNDSGNLDEFQGVKRARAQADPPGCNESKTVIMHIGKELLWKAFIMLLIVLPSQRPLYHAKTRPYVVLVAEVEAISPPSFFFFWFGAVCRGIHCIDAGDFTYSEI